MEQDLMEVAARLANAGIRLDVLEPDTKTEVFVAELPNGTQYLFSRVGLLRLRSEGKLNIPGIEGSGIHRQPRA